MQHLTNNYQQKYDHEFGYDFFSKKKKKIQNDKNQPLALKLISQCFEESKQLANQISLKNTVINHLFCLKEMIQCEMPYQIEVGSLFLIL